MVDYFYHRILTSTTAHKLSSSVVGWQITASGTATNLLSSPIPMVYFSTLDPDLKNESYNANMINICGKYCTDPEMYYYTTSSLNG